MEFIDTVIKAGSFVAALGAVGAAFMWVKKVILLCDMVKKQGIERAEENRLLFEGLLLIIELYEGKDEDGRLTAHKNKMEEYLYSKIN